MVVLFMILFSSDVGTEDRGGAGSVNMAEGVLEGAYGTRGNLRSNWC